MKIILSRKGFDSAAGGVPSPILPTGELYSIPIPDELSPKQYQEINAGEHSLGALVNDLSKGRIKPTYRAHLDPDLRYESIERGTGWRPLFGQAGASESHLRKTGVREGDIFLFFGWFKQVTQTAGGYSYVKGAPDQHIMFGWLQVERRIVAGGSCDLPLWAVDHPHFDGDKKYPLNTVYTSTEKLTLPNVKTSRAGAGAFNRYHESLCLTASGQLRSRWRLPNWFHPGGKNSSLSYHGNLRRWLLEDEHVLLQSAGRGQEFVLDCDEYPEAISWLGEILECCE
jgi:Nucleotide modification associated domain 3